MNQSTDPKTLHKGAETVDLPAEKRLRKPQRRYFGGLSSKLLLLTIAFVMLSEVFVFVPSVAKFRNDWLTDRLTRAQTVILMMQDASSENQVDADGMTLEKKRIEEALQSFDVITLAHREGGRRQLIAMLDINAGEIGSRFDVSETGPFQSIKDAFGTLLSSEPRTILVTGTPKGNDQLFEVIAREQPLRSAMLIYTRNVMILSFIISLLTASMVYLALNFIFVRPIRNMADNMVAFSQNPEASNNVIQPTGRKDELGVAEERLAAMQHDLQGTLSSQRHLANLGLAVSKINHDLRNVLASVQLFSDRLVNISDPQVQRFAPKLISGIDRAIAYCQSTLVYGSAREELPKRRLVRLHSLVDEMATLLDLPDHATIDWKNNIPETLEVEIDPEQIFRVLMNISRNAVKVLEEMEGEALVRRFEIRADKEEDFTRIRISDSGPGIPERAKEHLFEAFKGSFSKGGTGLGLAIAHEIVSAHGGTILLVDEDVSGTTFEINIPDQGKTIL